MPSAQLLQPPGLRDIPHHGKAGKRDKVGSWLLILGVFLGIFCSLWLVATIKPQAVRADLPEQGLWQSCWVLGLRCFWLSCAASSALSRPS